MIASQTHDTGRAKPPNLSSTESGVCSIVAGIQVLDLARVASTDYVNPDVPEERPVAE